MFKQNGPVSTWRICPDKITYLKDLNVKNVTLCVISNIFRHTFGWYSWWVESNWEVMSRWPRNACWSKEDCDEYKGSDIWKTSISMESDCLYKCLKCKKVKEDFDKMKMHILMDHKDNITSKWNLCIYEDNTWWGLGKHFKINHIETYE